MNTKTIKITSEEVAFEVLNQALNQGFGGQHIELDFENWPILELKICGSGYESTITAPIASAIVEIQRAINRSFSLIVHGRNSAAFLTDEERNAIQLKVKVEEGSTDLTFNLQQFAEKLAVEAVNKMSSEMVAITVIGTVALICGTYAFKHYFNKRTEEKTIAEDVKKSVALSQEETKRLEVMANAINKVASLRFVENNVDQARNSILKSVSDADRLSFNGVSIDSESARLAVTNKRDTAIDVQLNGTYHVTETNLKKTAEIKLGIRRVQDGKEFSASFLDYSLDGDQIKLLQEAEWGRTPVFLSINATELRGEISSAQVISVSPQPVSAIYFFACCFLDAKKFDTQVNIFLTFGIEHLYDAPSNHTTQRSTNLGVVWKRRIKQRRQSSSTDRSPAQQQTHQLSRDSARTANTLISHLKTRPSAHHHKRKG